MNVMMLTAGEGARLRPHTMFWPKPAICFLNVPLFLYPLQFLVPLKIDKIVMNTFHLPEKLKSRVQSFQYPYPIHFSDEENLLGSGGGIGHARSHFQNNGDFILMNGDEVIIPNQMNIMLKAIAKHQASGSIATLLVMDHPDVGTKFGGVWTNPDSTIIGFGKMPLPGAHKGYHYIGITIFSDRILNYIKSGESNILYDGLTLAIQDGQRAQVVPISCEWFETGNEIDFKSATKQCLESLTQSTFAATFLTDLIKSRSPNSQFSAINNKLLLADKSLSLNTQVLTGFNVLGANVQIKKGCRLNNCILGPQVRIEQADQLENTMIVNDQDVF